MDEQERARGEGLVVGTLMAGVITRINSESERSQQSASNVLGVSDIGVCREKARRMVLNEQPTQHVGRYDLASAIGTAVGTLFEEGISMLDPGWKAQGEVEVQLRVRGWVLTIVGHPDLFSRTNLIDFKTKNGLGMVRRSGPSDKERFQTALYAGALIRTGQMDERCYLHLAYIDRSGETAEPVIWSRPFSWDEVREAEAWLDDVIYAVEMGEEASRDKPREFCWAACEYAPACRGDDTDVEGLITDPEVIDALKVRAEAMEAIKVSEKDKKSAESVLRRFTGSTGEWTIRSIDIPETIVPEQKRAGYTRLDIRPVRARKQPVRKQRDNGTTALDEPGSEGPVAGGPAQRGDRADDEGSG